MKKFVLGAIIFIATTVLSSCDFMFDEKLSKESTQSIDTSSINISEKSHLVLEDSIHLDTTEIVEFVLTATDPIPMYNIIIGSFKNEIYASEYATDNDAIVMPISSSGFYRVSKERFDNRYDALLYMEGYQFTDSAVWIFKDVI